MLLILDENKEIVKSISADSTNGTHYFNDSHTEKVIDFDSTYEFSVSTDDESSKIFNRWKLCDASRLRR